MEEKTDINNWCILDLIYQMLHDKEKLENYKKAIEINNKFFISNSYPIEFIESYKFFIKVLAEKRVMFLPGSDAHSLDNVGKVPGNIFEELDISESQIWLPQSRNFA